MALAKISLKPHRLILAVRMHGQSIYLNIMWKSIPRMLDAKDLDTLMYMAPTNSTKDRKPAHTINLIFKLDPLES
jgi:hypothetical protein